MKEQEKMSKKILYKFTEENPNMHKQIGCINGIFQLFDRQHYVSGRRASQKRLTHGHSGNDDTPIKGTLPLGKDNNQKKAVKERQRSSSESSQTTFSSSSCSSTFSSIDCNKVSQLEPSSTYRTISTETLSRKFPVNQPTQFGQQNLRDVVKESIQRETYGLSVNSTKREEKGHTMKHIDSPRPIQLSKCTEPRVTDINESSPSLAKLREGSCSFNEAKNSHNFAPRDGPRFSYDERESRDTIKLKELPRFSLDSRAGSMRSQLSMGNQMEYANTRRSFAPQEEQENYKRSSSVVAKLMGLDALPNIIVTNDDKLGIGEVCRDQDLESFSRSSSVNRNDFYHNHIFGSPRKHEQGNVVSPSLRNADSVTKLKSSLRTSTEPFPSKKSDGSQGLRKKASKPLESPIMEVKPCHSVYGEMENRLSELEFGKSGKDLRALQQILEAMQRTKETLQIKQDQSSDSMYHTRNSPIFFSHNQKSELANKRNLDNKSSISSRRNQTSPVKSSESPIVIMKPATLVRKSSNLASPIIPIEGFPGRLRKLRTNALAYTRDNFADKKTYVDGTLRENVRGSLIQFHCYSDKNISNRAHAQKTSKVSLQTSKVSQQATVKSPSSAARSSGALSPRRTKKIILEKQPCPTTSSSVSSSMRTESNRTWIESNSQGRRSRPSSNFQQSDDQLSEICCKTVHSTHQDDAMSLKSASNSSFLSQIDGDVSSAGNSDDIITAFYQQGGQKHQNPVAKSNGEKSTAKLAGTASEQPSPVSVLDSMFFNDDLPSPVKKIAHAFEDDGLFSYDKSGSDNKGYNLSFDVDHIKLESIEHLVQHPTQLNSPQNDTSIDWNKNEYHRYISEIFLASGILSRDPDSLMSIQLHPTGYVLNPDLFLILEQTNTNMLSHNEQIKKLSKTAVPTEKINRKLVFDAVNEMLGCKLVSNSSIVTRFSQNKLAGRITNGRQILKEVCSEIDAHLHANNSTSSSEDDCDIIKQILCEDLKQQSPNWTDLGSDVSGLVLDIERSIFKDLVSEVVDREAAFLQARQGRHCRKLFAN